MKKPPPSSKGKKRTVKAWALTCDGKLLNEKAQWLRRIDAPAIVQDKSQFSARQAKEYGWDIVPCTITYQLKDDK